MTTTNTAIVLLIAAACLFPLTARASAPAPAPQPSPSGLPPSVLTWFLPCYKKTLLNISNCLTYLNAANNETAPGKACCPELAGLVESNPYCMCNLVGRNKTETLGISIDLDKAYELLDLCNVSFHPQPGYCPGFGPWGGGLGPEIDDDGIWPDSSGVGVYALLGRRLSSIIVISLFAFFAI